MDTTQTTAAAAAPPAANPRYQIKAFPNPGHSFFRRAGRAWGTVPVVVEVVPTDADVTVKESQITRAQFAMLTDAAASSRNISVVPVGDGGNPTAATAENIEMMRSLAAKEGEIAKLRGELSEIAEMRAKERREFEQAEMRSGNRITELVKELEGLRAQLATRTSSGGARKA